MNEEQLCLVRILQEAIKSVYQEERFLLQFPEGNREGLEQAFVFRTGIYLSNLLNKTAYATLDLDSEYNKNNDEAKTSRRCLHGLRPDLIIHRRYSNDDNKLVAEFKGWWNTDIDTDIKKLEDLTDPTDKYRYMIGVFIQIGKEYAKYRYFINGSEIIE